MSSSHFVIHFLILKYYILRNIFILFANKDNNLNNKTIYFCKELLCYSKEKRDVELLTISSYDLITSKREQTLKGLFPNLLIDKIQNNKENITYKRCFAFANRQTNHFYYRQGSPWRNLS